jgi:uncharacterized protein DUF2568
VSNNPAVLGLHFLLELCGLVGLAYWGWTTHQGAERWLWAIGLPLVGAVAWAILRAPGDGPDATVAIPGALRLLLELLMLCGAVVALFAADRRWLALAMAVLVVVDFTLSYDRVGRLLGL